VLKGATLGHDGRRDAIHTCPGMHYKKRHG